MTVHIVDEEERPSDTQSERVLTNRERLAGVVQAIGTRPVDIERRRWESLLVFAVFTAAYGFFGYWLVAEAQVVGFDTLDRFNRALMIWHNDPAKLAAVGFDYPPLAVLLLSPLTIFSALAKNMWVIPLGSAVFAALTMVVFNTMMRRAQIITPLRLAVLAGIGLNPLVVLYASTGSRHFMWIAFVIAAIGALFAWYVTADIRFVMIAGLSYAVAALSGYSSLMFFVVSAIMVGAILARLGADGDEVEGTTVGFASPTVYVIALWTAFNLILVVRPFNWITSASDRSGDADPIGFVELLSATGRLLLFGAPIAIVVLPALIFIGVSRRNSFALWIGGLLLVTILVPAFSVLLDLTDSPMLMRNALPILLVAAVGAIWLARSAGEGSTLIAGLLALGLFVSIPWTFFAMDSYKYQSLEKPFHEAISTGNSQQGTSTVNNAAVGIQDEMDMAEFIDENIDDKNSILTDNANTFAVMLFTGQPDLFVDRVDDSDGPWLDTAENPSGVVDFLLLSRSESAGDLLTELYPEAARGEDPLLAPLFTTDRYILVSVPPGFTRGSATLDDDPAETESLLRAP